MSSTKSSTDKDRPHGRTSSFQESNSAIRNKKDDFFSQIDSFQITAKKQAAEQSVRSSHPVQQQHYPGAPSMMNSMMPGMTQPFPQAQFPQATHFMQPQMYAFPNQQQPLNYGYHNQAHPVGVQLNWNQQSTTSTGYVPSTASAPVNGGFGVFGQFNSVAGETSVAKSENTFQTNPGIGDMFSKQMHQNVVSGQVQGFPSNVTGVVSASSTPAQNKPAEDEFQGFASFDAPTTSSDAEFTDFNGFVGSSEATPVPGGVEPKQKALDDDFGDFSAFTSPPASVEFDLQHSNDKQLPRSLDGKRMKIVTKKNLGASSAAVVKERTTSQNTLEVKPDVILTSKPRSSSSAGLANLAETLANAKLELNAPVIPRPEEQKDFSILQEVVNSLDNTSFPPVVQQQASFQLPDSPTKVNEIFPKCTPKKSSMDDSNVSSFEPFADFSQVTVQPLASEPNKEPTQDEFGGFADFSQAPVENPPTSDSFGEFSAPASVAAPVSTKEKKEEQTTPQIKSRAVDWSAFSALDDLRAEEEAGDLGDFSVFGGTLKVVEQGSVDQPNLLSPDEQPTNQLLDNITLPNNLSDRPIDAPATPTNQVTDKMSWIDSTNQVADDWAEFKEASSQPTPHVEVKEDDWAAFSEAPPTQAPPPLSTNEVDVFSQLSKEQRDIDTHTSAPGLPRVSSASFFANKFVNDVSNDSDWSDAAAIQPDNISSDWSFKDDVSMHEDVASNSSAGHSLNSPKVAVDWTEPSKPADDSSEAVKSVNDWPEPVRPTTDGLEFEKSSTNTQDMAAAVTPDADDWAAFGTIDRSQHENSDSDSRSRSSTVKVQPVDEVSSTGFHFSSSPPPFSPETPATVKNFDFTLENLSSADQDEWSAFDGPPEDVQSVKDVNSAPVVDDERLPPPVDEVDEWGDFGVTSGERDDSPVMFSPPPLTDNDFSPLKSRVQTDWFSYSSNAEPDDMNLISTSGDGLSPPDLHSPTHSAKSEGVQHSFTHFNSSLHHKQEVVTEDENQLQEDTLPTFNQLEGTSAAVSQSDEACSADKKTNDDYSAFDGMEDSGTPGDQPWKDSFVCVEAALEGGEKVSASDDSFAVFNSHHTSPADGSSGSMERVDINWTTISGEMETKAAEDELNWGFDGQDMSVESSTAKQVVSTDEGETAGATTPTNDFTADFEEFAGFGGEECMTSSADQEFGSTNGKETPDWSFQSKEDDDWSFKSPSPQSPRPLSPPAQASPTHELTDFSDDEFQEFDGTLSEPVASASQISSDQFSSLLANIFNAGSTPTPDISSSIKMTDLVKGSKMWRSLVDLNQSVSLQLEWRSSECRHHLESSLHITSSSANSLMDGVMQPLSLHSVDTSSTVYHSSLTDTPSC